MKNVTILNDLNTLNKLHTSSVESYTTNNGIADFTCDNNGYVDNVVIEGKTLVNLFSFKKTENSNNNSVWVHINTDYISLFKEVEYTLINTSDKNILVDIYSNDTNSYKRNLLIKANSSIKDTLTSNEHYSKCTGLFSDSWSLSDLSVISSTLIILEGDHTDKPISYFEGLKSAGQGDKIDVLTRNQSNKNLFYGDVELGYIDNKTGINGDSVNGVRSVEYIKVDKNTTYTISDDKGYNVSVNLYGENKSEYFGEIYGKTPYTFTTDDKTYWIRLRTFTGSKQNDTTIKWQLEKGNKLTEYVQPKYDKKQISTTLRSLPNGVKDTIEKRGNTYIKVQRCRELRLDGNSTFFTIREASSNTKVYRALLDVPLKDNKSGGKVFCDRFNSYANWELDEEECYVSINNTEGNAVCLKILKTRLENTMTKEKLLAWLDANPTTIVYELATPIITELPNFNPQTYKGENALVVNSGVIQCDASFDVCEGIRSELDTVKDKVSSIYDTVVEGIRETRHYPKLQNGWVTNSHDYTPTFVKFGNLVTFNMRIKGGKWSSATIIVDNLPEEFRVKSGHAQVFPAIDLANDKTYNAIMYKEGHIKLYGVDAEPTGGLAIMGTYYVN